MLKSIFEGIFLKKANLFFVLSGKLLIFEQPNKIIYKNTLY